MVEKVKSISTYNIANGQGSWSDPVPLGADIENIDITNQVTDPTVSSSIINDLLADEVTVSKGDTGAAAWTKFNRVKKVLHNLLTTLTNNVETLYNGINSTIATLRANLTTKTIKFTYNNDTIVGGNIVTGSGKVYFPIVAPPLATQIAPPTFTGNFALSFGDSNGSPIWTTCPSIYNGAKVIDASFNSKTGLVWIEVNVNRFINGSGATFANTFQNARSLQLKCNVEITFS